MGDLEMEIGSDLDVDAMDATPQLDYAMDGDMSGVEDVEDVLEYEEGELDDDNNLDNNLNDDLNNNLDDMDNDMDNDMDDVTVNEGDEMMDSDLVEIDESGEGGSGGVAESAGGVGGGVAESSALSAAQRSADSAGASSASPNPASATSQPNASNLAPNPADATAHAKSISEHVHMQAGSPQQKDKPLSQQQNEISLGVDEKGQDAVESGGETDAQIRAESGVENVPQRRYASSLATSGKAAVSHASNSDFESSTASGNRLTKHADASAAAYVDSAGSVSTGDGVFAAAGADGVCGRDHGASGGVCGTSGGASGAAGRAEGSHSAQDGLWEAAAGVPADVFDGRASARASDAVHAEDDDAAAGRPGQAAADSVAHEHASFAVHGKDESDAGADDGQVDAVTGEAHGARDHVSGEGVDARVEPAAGEDAAGLRGEAAQGHERAQVEDGGVGGGGLNSGGSGDGPSGDNSGLGGEFAEEFEDLEEVGGVEGAEGGVGGPEGTLDEADNAIVSSAASDTAIISSAASGGPGALSQGAEADLPLDEEATEALQGHAEAAAHELADNTSEYYAHSLDLDLSVPVLLHFDGTGKTYRLCGEHADFPPLVEGLGTSELHEYSLEEVFVVLRRSLEGFCSMDDELVLSFEALGLQLGEDNVCARDATLQDLIRLFQTFAANTVDYLRPSSFDLHLSLCQRFNANYNRLYSLAQQGHSLADLSDLRKEEIQKAEQNLEGSNLGKEILGTNSAALEDEEKVARETSRKQEASLEFAKSAFSGKNVEDPEDVLEPELDTNYVPQSNLPAKRGLEDEEVTDVKKPREE
ncbi:hypothetical protein CJU89_6562 [Yarrowia sp. B02]|nr:hypothetical protein CJU89_6562 [Yarrowia sp. B02]